MEDKDQHDIEGCMNVDMLEVKSALYRRAAHSCVGQYNAESPDFVPFHTSIHRPKVPLYLGFDSQGTSKSFDGPRRSLKYLEEGVRRGPVLPIFEYI